MKREPSAWGSAAIAAALGLLLGIREARRVLLEAALRVDGFAELPRPRASDWIVALRPALTVLTRADALLALAALALAVWLLLRLVRTLSPGATLRINPAAAPSAGPWYTVPLDDRTAKRAAAAAALCFYLFGGVRWIWQAGTDLFAHPAAWGLSGLALVLPGRPLTGLILAFLLGGALLWLLWGERGALARPAPKPPADPLTTPAPAPPPEPPAAPDSAQHPVPSTQHPAPAFRGLAARGALAGLLALPLLLPFTAVGRELLLRFVALLSPTDTAPWRWLAGGALVWYPAALLALVGLTHALGRPGLAAPRRARLALLPAVAAVVAAGAGGLVYAVLTGDRYGTGRSLEEAVPGLRAIRERRVYLLFADDGRAWSGMIPYGSIQGIGAGRDVQERVWEYLRRHDYQTPFTSRLFVHLYDAAAVEWDSAEILKVCLAELEGNPDPLFARLLLEKLSHCPITPANRAALDALADPSRFRFDSSFGRQTLAHLYRRFGDLAQASEYGTVTPRPFDEDTAPLTNGVVSGRILINGRPRPGLRVGLVPADQAGGLFGAPPPFEHRWIAAGATTGSDGRFRIPNLGEGDYLLIVMGRGRELRLRSEAVETSRHPGVVRVDRFFPTRDLGTIDALTDAPPPPGTGGGRGQGPRAPMPEVG